MIQICNVFQNQLADLHGNFKTSAKNREENKTSAGLPKLLLIYVRWCFEGCDCKRPAKLDRG